MPMHMCGYTVDTYSIPATHRRRHRARYAQAMLEIYADESSTSNNRYTVIGGVVLHSDRRALVEDRLAAIYRRYRLARELKWERVHRSHFIAYRNVIDEFFMLNRENRLHFHAVIVDSHQVRGDRELGHSKFVYQLLLKFGRRYAPREDLVVYLDDGKLQMPVDELCNILNAGIAKRWRIATAPFSAVRTIDSKTCHVMQANDLIIGAISHAKNERHLDPVGRPREAAIIGARENER